MISDDDLMYELEDAAKEVTNPEVNVPLEDYDRLEELAGAKVSVRRDENYAWVSNETFKWLVNRAAVNVRNK